MATTATYNVINPTPGVVYQAPVAYQVIPDAGTKVTCTCQTFDSAGNLVVTTITSYDYDVTAAVNRGSFTYTGNTCNAATTNTNGSDIFAPSGKATGSVYRLAMYLTYTGRTVNRPPNAPAALSPTGSAVVTTLTPTLTGGFSDPDAGNTLYQYEILVNNAANGGGAQVWDSGVVNASSGEISAAAFSKVYAGTALTFGSTYSWRARTADNSGSWGPYSAWQNFVTAQGPNAPGSVTPAGLQSSLTPAFSFVYSHPTALGQQSYHYKITAANGGALVYDSGTVASAVANNATVSGTIPGGAGLQAGQSYIFTVFSTDTNSASGPATAVNFSTAAIPSVTPSSPTNNATANTTTPTFSWAYNDPNYTQASYQIQIYNAATGALIKDTGVVASAATSYLLSGTTIAFGTNCRWRIQVVDTAGIGSGYSAYAYFTVQNAPAAAITAPSNGSTITNNTPNVTWTYTPGSGAFAQASAQVFLLDTNNNVIATYSLAGTGTTLAIPAGILQNTVTYHLQVKVTDSSSQVGSSVITSFTLLYTPPADLQGQALANGKNFVLSPYLNLDSNADGVADNFTLINNSGGWTYTATIDPTIQQPWQQPNGDGPFIGAQKLSVTGGVGAGAGNLTLIQNIIVATAGWTAGVTRISAEIWGLLRIVSGSPRLHVQFDFYNGGVFLSSASSTGIQVDTAGQIVNVPGPQNALIPATCTIVKFEIIYNNAVGAGDLGDIIVMGAQCEAASASDANFIGGANGTGFSYDGNGYSVRSLLAGNPPTIAPNPGQDTDPINANGGTITLGWDTSLADATRFTGYLIERRRQDQSLDDTAWVTLAIITNKAIGSFTDWSAGGSVSYQYSVRQTIIYVTGETGVSANRTLTFGSVTISPAWYLTNADGTIYNLRLDTAGIDRTFGWRERAVYSDFIGRIGTARDAGPPAGQLITQTFYFNDTWGDDHDVLRRLLIVMQQLNVIWFLKNPTGVVLPCYLENFDIVQKDTGSDRIDTLTLTCRQAKDTSDF